MYPVVSLYQLLLALVVIVTMSSYPVEAANTWAPSVQVISEDELESLQSGEKVTTLAFSIPRERFSNLMGSDTYLFPGSCTSSVTKEVNRFGWEAYKGQVFINAKNSYRYPRTYLTLNLKPTPGFTATFEETIKCGQGFVNKNGDSYKTSPGELADSAKNIVFTIQPKPFVVLKLLNINNVAVWSGLDGNQKNSGLEEKYVRDSGFVIKTALENDAWNLDYKEEILKSFTCTSSLQEECDWFYQITNDTSLVSFPPDQPNVVLFNVTRTHTRLFSINNNLNIRMDVPTHDTTNHTYGYKPSTATWRLFDSQITFKIMAEPISPATTWKDFTISEACLRGKTQIDPSCNRMWAFQMKRHPTVDIQFVISTKTIADIAEVTFKSEQLDYVNPVGAVQNPPKGGAVDPYILQFYLRDMLEYEISVPDTIVARLPYSLFTLYEPPKETDKVTITVTPSQGQIVGEVFDVQQRDLWRGGVVMKMTMGGESWDDSMNSSAALLKYSVGDITHPLAGGWNLKSVQECLLPEGAVRFGRDMTGKENKSELVLNFQPCPSFLLDRNETIKFSFPLNDNRIKVSTLDIFDQSNLEFIIYQSPGEFALLPDEKGDDIVFEEADVIAGRTSFSIVLLGEVWKPTAAEMAVCYQQIISAWTADVALSSVDSHGWSFLDSRKALLGADDGFPAFNKTGKHRLEVSFQNNTVYDTRKGEKITITLPPQCLVSENTILASANVSARLHVVPKNGNVTVYVAAGDVHNNPSLIEATYLSESRVRNGGFYLLLVVNGDTFTIDETEPDTAKKDALRQAVIAGIATESEEPSGFGKKKDFLLDWKLVQLVNHTHIMVPMKRYLKFDIKNNQTIAVSPQGEWMGSGRKPLNGTWDATNCFYGNCPYNFSIVVSAGDINVEWFGQPNASVPLINVTEDDIRNGKLWFTFKLLGDQWRQERSAFRSMFTSDSPQPTGMKALSQQLVPAIEFFVFKTTEFYEVCDLRLQSSDAFDVDRDEDAEIQLDGRSMASGIPPVFFRDGDEFKSFALTIRVVPGRAILSGVGNGFNEKMLRRGGVKLFITLFGEKWVSRTESDILNEVVPIFGGSQASLLQLDSVVVTPGSSSRELVLSLKKDESYNINSEQILEVLTPAELMRSGLTPIHLPFMVPIAATGGELVYTSLTVISEQDIRQGEVRIDLKLLGDEWNVGYVVSNRQKFLDGFSSLSSSVQEPNGFFTNRDILLRRDESVSASVTIVTISLQQAPRYDIDTDELLTFTITTTDVVTTSEMPDPNSVTIRIKTHPRNIICIAEDSFPNMLISGAYNTRQLAYLISIMLSCDTQRVQVHSNGTRLGDREVVVVRFVGQGDGITEGDRTSAELGDMMLSIRNEYLYEHMGVKWAYYEDQPPAPEDIRDPEPTEEPLPPVEPPSNAEIFAWAFGAVGFVGVVVAGFTFGQYVKQGKLAGTARRGNNPDGADRYGAHTAFTDIPDEVGGQAPSEKPRNNKGGYLGSLNASQSPSPQRPQSAEPSPGNNGTQSPNGATAVSFEKSPQQSVGALSTIQAERPMTMKDYVRSRMGVEEAAITQQDLDINADVEQGGHALSRQGEALLDRQPQANTNLRRRHAVDPNPTQDLTHLRSSSRSSSSGGMGDREEQLKHLLQATSQRQASGRVSVNTPRTLESMMDINM